MKWISFNVQAGRNLRFVKHDPFPPVAFQVVFEPATLNEASTDINPVLLQPLISSLQIYDSQEKYLCVT